jgi:hypothetical protein
MIYGAVSDLAPAVISSAAGEMSTASREAHLAAAVGAAP